MFIFQNLISIQPWCLYLGVLCVVQLVFQLLYGLKFTRLKIFAHFVDPVNGHKKFLLKFITDAKHGWKLDHKNFICEKLFLSRIWQNHKIVTP